MERELEKVKLKLDEENALTFEVKIEGEIPGSSPVYRLVCESNDMAYSFRGSVVDGAVQFIVPPLQNKLNEGVYNSHLEVVIENKLLIPIEFQADFSITTKVQVESIRVENKATQIKNAPVSAAAKLLKTEIPKQRIETKIVEKKHADVSPAKVDTVIQKKKPTLKEVYAKRMK